MGCRDKFIDLRCKNTATTLSVEFGTTLGEVLAGLEFEQPYPILAARVNNAYKDLSYKVYKPVTVEFFDIRHFEGYRGYRWGLLPLRYRFYRLAKLLQTKSMHKYSCFLLFRFLQGRCHKFQED